MNYEQARKIMKTARDPAKGKPIANNTRLRYNQFRDYYSVRLHGNEILKIFPDRFEPYDAGWRTVTTKARLNEYMPIGRIHQKDFTWYYTIGDTTYDWDDVVFVSTLFRNYGDVMLHSTMPKWASQMQEVTA